MPPSESIESAILPLLVSAVAADVALLVLLLAIAWRFRARLRDGWRELAPAIPRRDAIAIGLMTLAAAAIRVPLLARAMGTDEAATFLYYASKPLTLGLSIYGSPNNHLLHTALMHGAWRLFGAEEWALRLPALLFGVALVPLAYCAARTLVRDGALVAAALAGALPVLVDYSTDARGYTMLCVFTLIAVIAAARAGNAAAAVVFAVAVALGAYAVPAMLYPFVLLVAWRPRKLLVAAALAAVLTLMLYLPTLAVSGLDAITSNAYVRPLPFGRFLAAAPRAAAAVWRSWMAAVPLVLQLALAAGFVARAIRNRLTLWLGAIAVVAVVAAQRVIPFPRVWLPFALLFLITAAGALPWGRWELAFAAALFAGLAALALTVPRPRETGELPHVRAIARELAARAAPSDGIEAATPSDLPLAFYLDGRVLRPRDPGTRRIYVVINRAYGRVPMDARGFIVRPVRDFGAAAIYVMDRR